MLFTTGTDPRTRREDEVASFSLLAIKLFKVQRYDILAIARVVVSQYQSAVSP